MIELITGQSRIAQSASGACAIVKSAIGSCAIVTGMTAASIVTKTIAGQSSLLPLGA